MIAGFFTPQRRRSEPARQPGRFQTARIGARSRRRSHTAVRSLFSTGVFYSSAQFLGVIGKLVETTNFRFRSKDRYF
jgi:hypothetical protein